MRPAISGIIAAMNALVLESRSSYAALPFILHRTPPRRGKAGFRLRTPGRAYPHSSTRQQARYARQIAAGQLIMEGIAR